MDFFEGKDLVLEGVVGLGGAAGGLGLVELLDLALRALRGWTSRRQPWSALSAPRL